MKPQCGAAGVFLSFTNSSRRCSYIWKKVEPFSLNFTIFVCVIFLSYNIAKYLSFCTYFEFFSSWHNKIFILWYFVSKSLSNIIIYLTMKRYVLKQKQSLILFHLFGMIITFWGLMKITGNVCGVIKVSKESMLLRLLLMYWGKRLWILKVVMFLRKNLI